MRVLLECNRKRPWYPPNFSTSRTPLALGGVNSGRGVWCCIQTLYGRIPHKHAVEQELTGVYLHGRAKLHACAPCNVSGRGAGLTGNRRTVACCKRPAVGRAGSSMGPLRACWVRARAAWRFGADAGPGVGAGGGGAGGGCLGPWVPCASRAQYPVDVADVLYTRKSSSSSLVPTVGFSISNVL